MIGMVFFRATRSDAKSDVRKGKALPARRFESVRRHSQERFRTPPSLRGLDRIETVIQDETGKKAGIKITLPREQRWKGMIPRRVNNECAVGSLDRSQASTAAMSTVSTVADAAANQATLAATGVPGGSPVPETPLPGSSGCVER